MATNESCFHCVYSRWDRNQTMWMMGVGMPSRPMCANQADYPGRMKECPLGRVCRNFRVRPPSPKGETVETIPLGDGYYAYVDAADYEWLSRWKWHMQGGYAVRYEKKKLIFMHRQIMQPPKGMIVDHKNRNRLDNTRENLRNATHQENTQNAGKIQGTYSRFKGVSYRRERDKYFAQIYYLGEQFYLGLFAEEIDAARAYDRRAVELFGEFARVNLPEEWPPERRREIYAQRGPGLKGGRKAKKKRGETAGAVAQKSVGATHASPVQKESKRTKAGKRKTAKAKKKSRAETRGRRDGERKTDSARGIDHGLKGNRRRVEGKKKE